MTIIEVPITIIDPDTKEPKRVTAVINHATSETYHRLEHQGADTVLVEEEPDG